MTKSFLVLALAFLVCGGCATSAPRGNLAGAERIAELRKEADSGSVVAAYRVFLLCAQRDEVAMKYLRSVADRYVPAMMALGAILLESDVANDRAEGEKYLRMAALAGDVDARNFLEIRGIKW